MANIPHRMKVIVFIAWFRGGGEAAMLPFRAYSDVRLFLLLITPAHLH